MTEPTVGSVRVAVVDDSAFIRRAVVRMLSDVPGISVVATGCNGREAVDLARQLHPDVIVMDVNMPEMDGLSALERIMREAPTAVLVLSTVTSEGAEVTLRALELGAVDFIDKTTAGTAMDIHELQAVLRDKVLAVAGVQPPPPRAASPPQPRAERLVPAQLASSATVELIAIGASTGGPRALSRLLPNLPADLPVPIVIAQHMPEGFTSTLAQRLDNQSQVAVREARDGDALEPALALIAPGGKQMRVVREDGRLVARVSGGAPGELHHPSVDLLFRSIADAVGSGTVAVVLTGMGADGAAGLRQVRDGGGRTVAESQDTAVIYGMPRAAGEWADEILPLDRIAPALVAFCMSGAAEGGG
ncbi:chemotaxis response regulator protein-glutamate methylesterase [soil metagenome]